MANRNWVRGRWALVVAFGLVGCNLPEPTMHAPEPDPLLSPGVVLPSASPSLSPSASPGPGGSPTPMPAVVAAYRMFSVAGNGVRGDSDNGVAATSTSLFSPTGLALGADGSLYIADYKINRIRKVDPAGVISLFAGNSLFPSEGGDEGPALQAGLAKPYCLVSAPNGDLVFSEYGYSVPGTDIPGKVRRIDANGIVHRVAGGGLLDVTNGVAGLQANLKGPQGLVFDHAGNLYIAEYNAHRVVKLDAAGNLTVVAGTGDSGNDGDGGLAIAAHLNAPNWLALSPSGDLVIVDSANHNVRAVNAAGTIRTLAGTGVPTNDPAIVNYVSGQPTALLGDGGPATSATLHTPTSAAFDPAGDLVVADSENGLVRRISPAGTITSIAGTGADPQGGLATIPDGTDALLSPITMPDGLFIDPVGRIYFSEYSGYRVRVLTP